MVAGAVVQRELTSLEVKKLEELRRGPYVVLQNLWKIVPLFLILDVLFVLGVLTHVLRGNLTEIAGPLILAQVLLLASGLREAPLYLDMRSPVFKIEGPVEKGVAKLDDKNIYTLKIQGVGLHFREEETFLKEQFEKIENGDTISVEFSPRTKRVWKIAGI